ncbi:MAG: YlbF family regulator [Peptococcaceae bacterium]|nr:YlbF family regulator [Peptococcaceae bacterium]
MDVLAKTKELCDLLNNSPEFKELTRAETILRHDPDAQDLIRHFNDAQDHLQNLYTAGKQAAPEDFARLRKLEGEMAEDPSTGPYLQAQQKFNGLLTQINQMITEAIKQPNDRSGTGTGSGNCNCGKHELS